ncbi:MAG: monofunctional biosynthetic peptidoglycan transglycosylase [Acidobacteria bacterium RIFCSPLOWO2_02_FULL_68_18]|nr:MAG: monofunctional biosynthetic peptidoglycan transglycosylase [Acidobacteria bacterium RIFCSPLOWO2_02_FULL_68_18]OFW50996.1 MAG: monofunctional biosynthetic peptidoglycan transglycosylase [Acidobacteria bacterium RIFCSPLOWO2_12_FULL_68_19]
MTKRRLLRALATATAAGFGLLVYAYLTLPDVRVLAKTNPSTTAFMELRAAEGAREGRTVRRVQRWVPYSHISPALKRAVLVAEDAAFWDHEGVDYDELRESMRVNWEQGRAVRGASTITQQLAKNLYLSPSRDPLRKLRELIIARRLEAALPKARIFEIYLNAIEWGDGIWGAEAAARTYFGVPASALSRDQAALLAGAIVNPRVLNPARPSARLYRRQRLILSRMGEVTPPAPVPLVAAAPEGPFGDTLAPGEAAADPVADATAREGLPAEPALPPASESDPFPDPSSETPSPPAP